jgi:hypothetical protein
LFSIPPSDPSPFLFPNVKVLFKGHRLQLRDVNEATEISNDGGHKKSPAGITSNSGTANGRTVHHKKNYFEGSVQ